MTASSMAAAMLQVDVMFGGADMNTASAAENTALPQLALPPTIPFSTRRSYKQILLPNGLKVLLVSDKKAFRASAALCISGAGQFQEDPDIGGLAHLMEHMVSSAASKQDFEDWLTDQEGASNAFTAPDRVCYHFNVPPESFSGALLRFSELFLQEAVVKACRNEAILKREIRRVDSELDFRSDFNRAFYLVKSLINKDHPFSRFTQGSYDSLERIPSRKGIDVTAKLIEFFDTRYLPSRASLVVICPTDLDSLERWVAPFSSVLSSVDPASAKPVASKYTAPKSYGTKPSQYVLWHPKGDSPLTENIEKLSLQWLLERSYEGSGPVLTSTTIGFFISQLIDRRGPGSLYMYLLRRSWIPEGNQGLPRITFPIDVSGFQLMRLDIALTLEGFANRSAVVAAVYDCLQAVLQLTGGSFNVPDDILKQYVTIARLYGYNIAPRPPDAVELAFDSETYGMGGSCGVGTEGVWPIVPPLEDPNVLGDLRKGISDVLRVITDPKYAIIIITASNKSILQSRSSFVDDPIPPPLMSDRWKIEPISGARYLSDDFMSIYGQIEEWLTNRFEEDEIQSPSYNPLIPSKLRPPRAIKEQIMADGSRRLYYLDTMKDTVWREFVTKPTNLADRASWNDRAVDQDIGPDWQLYQTVSGALPLPMMPEEATCRCSLVIQLLSTRPARASVNQAAYAQLWLLSFDNTIQDLVSLLSHTALCLAS
jgi:insulysin